MFAVVLLTEALSKAPLVLHYKLGYVSIYPFFFRCPHLPQRLLSSRWPLVGMSHLNNARRSTQAAPSLEPELSSGSGLLQIAMQQNRFDLRLYAIAKDMWIRELAQAEAAASLDS